MSCGNEANFLADLLETSRSVGSGHQAASWRDHPMSTPHGDSPEVVAFQIPSGEKLVGGEETGRGCALHKSDWKIAADSVTGEYKVRFWSGNLRPQLPGPSVDQRAVVLEQPLFSDHRGLDGFGIDAA